MIPFIISLTFFMEAIDTTAINTAIPAMAISLNVHPVDLKIALISYLVSLAIFIPISGWVADKFGIKKVFMIAVVIFTLSSVWCGFSDSLYTLVIARFLQGMGGALGLPVGRLIIVRTFGRENLITVMNRVVMVGALGMMLGPTLGGFITHYLSWHWIFWINLPFGLLNLVLAYYWLPPTEPLEVPPLDKKGFILFSTALAGLTFGFSALSESNIEIIYAVIIIIVAVILLLVYVWHSRSQAHPIVNPELLKTRTFRVSFLGNLLSRLGFGGSMFLLPLLLQVSLHYSPQLSGILLAPIALGVLIIKPIAITFLRSLGYRKLLALNTLLAGLSLWSFIFIDLNTPIGWIAFLTFIYGIIVSLQYTAMNSLAYADVPPQNFSSATSIMSTLQQLVQSFGVAASAFLLRFFSSFHQSHLFPSTFHYTFFILGIITMVSVVIFLRLKPEDGSQML